MDENVSESEPPIFLIKETMTSKIGKSNTDQAKKSGYWIHLVDQMMRKDKGEES